jgi:adenosylmethionine-8-amino-7-oxononanoate aminotransferase
VVYLLPPLCISETRLQQCSEAIGASIEALLQ